MNASDGSAERAERVRRGTRWTPRARETRNQRRDEDATTVESTAGSGGGRQTRPERVRPDTTETVRVEAEVADPKPTPTGPAADPATTSGADGSAQRGTTRKRATKRTAAPEEAPKQRGAGAGHPGEAWRLRPGDMRPEDIRSRWRETQGGFVDDPRQAVREADALAAQVADAVVAEIQARRSALRSAWNDGADPDTESLRLTLRAYRSFVRNLTGDHG